MVDAAPYMQYVVCAPLAYNLEVQGRMHHDLRSAVPGEHVNHLIAHRELDALLA